MNRKALYFTLGLSILSFAVSLIVLLLTGCATTQIPQHADKALIPSGTDRAKIIACQADLNRDGALNLSDTTNLASQLGQLCQELPVGTPCADLARDGIVNLSDISVFAEAYHGTQLPSVALCNDPSIGDNDGLSVWDEQTNNFDPENPDTDGDGIDDLHELEPPLAPCKIASWDGVNHHYKTNILFDPPLTDAEGLPITQADISGYKIYYGNEPGVYLGSTTQVGTAYTKINLSRGLTYYYAIATMRPWTGHPDVEGLKSGYVCSKVP